ncbi:ankyrin repeat domain-containing protein [Pedobacter petrophilus]|uniref:Ankyrin repeat domain-containing protein n=1 Tax=Pedobacter petrophilus TaxID=1908241 RepID=A0A7K0FZM8_9SPHI|nr:ankyrin repeat domain-containing protein [Pedobacter petrophilus]MRX76534.1 ankyrin repeat domain-containing protein [Pedobacter petrophilus]
MKKLNLKVLIFLIIIASSLSSCEQKVKEKRKVERETLDVAHPVIAQTDQGKYSEPTWQIVDEFYDAISANNTKMVSDMLATKFPVNFQPKNKIRPLDAVIRTADNLQLAKLFIDGGANMEDKKDEFILGASEHKRLAILKYLVEKGAKFKNNGAFNKAGFYHFYDGAKYLLMSGANPNIGDVSGKLWVFHEAVRKSDYTVLNALRLTKDDLEFNDCDGKTALIIAIKTNNIEMVKYLLKKGVDRNKPETFDCGDDIYYGKLPIEFAKENNFKEMVELLK